MAECLRPGGHWLNVGPLNYVHDGRRDGGEAAAIPLSWETLRSVILGRNSMEKFGLRFSLKNSLRICLFVYM